MSAPLPLKAFAVLENGENTGGILFARHAITARKAGANEFNGGDFEGMSCRRAPWADCYAESGLVPARVMVAHGWHFECCGCGMTIDEDHLYDQRLSVDGVVGSQRSSIFCSTRCARKHYRLLRRRMAAERQAIDALMQMVRQRFGDVTFAKAGHHAYVQPSAGGWLWHQVIVNFDFPGMRIRPACLRLDHGHRIGPPKPEYLCCSGDREAFEAFAAVTKAGSS